MACDGMGMASSLHPPTSSQTQTPHDHEEDPYHHHLPLSSSLSPLLDQDYNAATLLGKRSMEMHWVRLGDRQACGEMINREDELSDDCSQLGEKKRRLKQEQVRTLEKNFELGSRLEPERKMQLARALGLHPRQIAIWFQNRRARWKTKQLEKDYDALKKQFEAVKSDNDALKASKKKLQAEILALKGREITSSEPTSLNKETEVSCSYRSDNSSDVVNLDITRSTPPNADNPIAKISHHRISSSSSFPATRRQPATATHLLLHQCQKAEHGGGQDDAAGFCNMFYGLDDQPAAGVWTPWQEQQSFR